jgi:ankyrin repeat protein
MPRNGNNKILKMLLMHNNELATLKNHQGQTPPHLALFDDSISFALNNTSSAGNKAGSDSKVEPKNLFPCALK